MTKRAQLHNSESAERGEHSTTTDENELHRMLAETGVELGNIDSQINTASQIFCGIRALSELFEIVGQPNAMIKNFSDDFNCDFAQLLGVLGLQGYNEITLAGEDLSGIRGRLEKATNQSRAAEGQKNHLVSMGLDPVTGFPLQ